MIVEQRKDKALAPVINLRIHGPRRFVDADRGRRTHRRGLGGVDLVVRREERLSHG